MGTVVAGHSFPQLLCKGGVPPGPPSPQPHPPTSCTKKQNSRAQGPLLWHGHHYTLCITAERCCLLVPFVESMTYCTVCGSWNKGCRSQLHSTVHTSSSAPHPSSLEVFNKLESNTYRHATLPAAPAPKGNILRK